ncbi:MAG: DUF4345 family protein [Pseudomonadota bacterium]
MKLILILITVLLTLVTLGFGGLWFGLGLQTIEVVGGNTLPITEAPEALAMADNSVRFLAGVWIATGIGLFICLRNITENATLFSVIMGGLFLGGLGRLLSFYQLGIVDAFVIPTAIELILPPIAIALQSALARRSSL